MKLLHTQQILRKERPTTGVRQSVLHLSSSFCSKDLLFDQGLRKALLHVLAKGETLARASHIGKSGFHTLQTKDRMFRLG